MSLLINNSINFEVTGKKTPNLLAVVKINFRLEFVLINGGKD